MFSALTKAFGDLRDKRLMATLIAIALWSLGLYIAIMIAMFWGLGAADLGAWAENQLSWLPAELINIVATLVAILAFVALFWFSFIIVAQNVAAFYLDGVVERVEAIDYPGLPKARGSSIANDVTAMIRFTGVLLVLNVAALPFYILGLFIPFVTIAIFYLLNGYLFGREYAEVVALRRLPQKEARAWRKANGTRVWMAGALIAFAMTIPVLNFLGPVVAAAFMTHIYHSSRRGRPVDNSASG
jgi:CysZ protein